MTRRRESGEAAHPSHILNAIIACGVAPAIQLIEPERFGIMMLKETLVSWAGFGYDDPLSKHLPELLVFNNITLRHLLHHISGVRDLYVDPEANTALIRQPASPLTNADVIKTYAHLLFPMNSAAPSSCEATALKALSA